MEKGGEAEGELRSVVCKDPLFDANIHCFTELEEALVRLAGLKVGVLQE